MPSSMKPQKRECLKCGDTFLSLGHHNRLCDPCRLQNRKTSNRVTKTNSSQKYKGKSDNEGSY